MPPPMHSVARPFLASRRAISNSSVFRMRAPEAQHRLATVLLMLGRPFWEAAALHLGTTDKGISAYRRLLVKAIEANLAGEKELLMQLDAEQAAQLSGPPSIDGISDAAGVPTYCEVADRKRREGSDWASKRLA